MFGKQFVARFTDSGHSIICILAHQNKRLSSLIVQQIPT